MAQRDSVKKYRLKNRLAGEKSPYLLRQAESSISWYPWGREAFEAAGLEDKPIFLSIGYSSCHWCHLMEQECFNDDEVALLMNDACIPVRVDREERPDLETVFWDICRIQNGSGGWPLNLFLTPEGKPFFASAWLPKRTIGRMPGLTDILPRVKWLWTMQREDVLRGANELSEMLKLHMEITGSSGLGFQAARDAFAGLQAEFDADWGGFGESMKLPLVPRLLFLLAQARLSVNSAQERDEAFAMVNLTLRRMWRGGIHDHLGGGFANCSVDRKWVIPHFEKILCDQAMILWAASEAHDIRPDNFYVKLAEDIVNCVSRDFTAPESCFWTAIDSDVEGIEGLYYMWREEEIREILPQGHAGLFCAAYAVMPGGNFGHEFTNLQTGYNVLYEAITSKILARRYGISEPEVSERLAACRNVLLQVRNSRPSPSIDRKVLMDWNGLMIGALAYASRVFARPEWRLRAEKAALYLQKALVDPKGNWRRRLKDGEAGIAALPGDYAALMWGIMRLYDAVSADGEKEKQKKDWIRYAEALAEKLLENFKDTERGGFFLSTAEESFVFLRYKTALDSSLPSANAMAAYVMAELAEASGEKKYLDEARGIVSCFAHGAALQPLSHLFLMLASFKIQEVRIKVKAAEAIREKEEQAAARADEEHKVSEEHHEEEQQLSGRPSRTDRERTDRQIRSERRSARARPKRK